MTHDPSHPESLPGLDHFKLELRRALLAHAATLPSTGVPSPRPSLRRGSQRRLTLGFAASAAVIVLVTVVVLGVGSGPAGSPGVARAALVLRAAAGSLLRHAPQPLGVHQYWYTRVDTATQQETPGGHESLKEELWQRWVSRDGAGRDQEGRGRSERLAPNARPFPFGFAMLSYRQLLALPTSPPQLSAELSAIAARQQRVAPDRALLGTPAGRAYILFTLVRDAFEAPAPPALRAALYKLAAGLRGVALDGDMADHAGRPGVAVSVVLGAVRFRLIVDPRTGELLETQRILVRRSDQLGSETRVGLYSRGTFLSGAVVSRVGQRAPARAR